MTRTLRAAAVALVLALVPACAGGDDDRLSKQKYEQKVQALYAEVQQAFRNTSGASGRELAGGSSSRRRRSGTPPTSSLR